MPKRRDDLMWYSVALCSFLLVIFILTGCQYGADASAAVSHTNEPAAPVRPASNNEEVPLEAAIPMSTKKATAAEIIARKQIPILCYHQVRDWKATDSKSARDYIVPVEAFKAQMKMLADSGYKTISCDQLVNYLNTGTGLPAKPVILTYDDTDLDQFTVARPVMDQYGFKGTFFVMTVSLGRPRYMSKEQVRQLSDEGHEIGSHTWDHQNVKKLQGDQWITQIDKPTATLEKITGKKVKYFAYPFGLWNPEAIPQLKQRGFSAAFQLSTSRDESDPLYTIRRIIVPGTWSGATLSNVMQRSFK